MTGTIFSIEEFATFDGPGIRTAVFLKGCPLSCTWCHNPEGQSASLAYRRSSAGCLHCGACLSHAAQNAKGERRLTEASAKACPRRLIQPCGEHITTEALCARLLKTASILNETEGGVTFSGGEPLAQPAFLLSLLKALKGRVHLAIETTGYAETDVFREVIALCDYVLYDLKPMDEETHIAFCGVSNKKIHANYRLLVGSGVPFITRVPLIPGVTDTEKNCKVLAEFLSSLGVKTVELLPYNRAAGAKYASLLRTYDPRFDAGAPLSFHEDIFRLYGIEPRIM